MKSRPLLPWMVMAFCRATTWPTPRRERKLRAGTRIGAKLHAGKLDQIYFDHTTSLHGLRVGHFWMMAEWTGDSANSAQAQCSCGFLADSHSKAGK